MDDDTFFDNLHRQMRHDEREWNYKRAIELEQRYVSRSKQYTGASLVSAGMCECGDHYKVYVRGSQEPADAVCPKVIYLHKCRESIRNGNHVEFQNAFPYDEFIAKFRLQF